MSRSWLNQGGTTERLKPPSLGVGMEAFVFLQTAENDRQLRSRLEDTLNGDPAASPTRRRAQMWCSLFVAPCAPEGTPAVSS